MQWSYFAQAARECAGRMSRETRVLLTPPPRPEGCWLFLVGCYNSGTTLLAQLLGQHPSISALPTEGHFITDQFIKDYDVGLPRMWSQGEHLFRLTEADEGPDPVRIKKEWGARLDRRRPVLLEKSPPNTVRTRWLQKHFAPARFVAIVRNGYAVAEGILRKADPRHLPEGWPIEACAHQWVRSYEVLLEDAPHLEHLLWVRYEDLLADPPTVLSRIAEFAGVDRFPAVDSARTLSVHERNEPLRDMNVDSLKRLSSEQIRRIEIVAGPLLQRFGYRPESTVPAEIDTTASSGD